MEGFTDIHHHLIYGIDADGPQTFVDTCVMLRAAQEDGIHAIIATPHVAPGIYPFHVEEFTQRIEQARAHCIQEGIDIEIHPGAEIFYTEMTLKYLRERRIPTMAGTSFVLIEFPPDIRYDYLLASLTDLARSGFIPILAHAERYRCLTLHPRRACTIRQQIDMRYQINCSSLLDGGGFFVNRFCRVLLDGGLADAIASDAHNVSTRAVAMGQAFKSLLDQYEREYAESLTGYHGHQILQEASSQAKGAI